MEKIVINPDGDITILEGKAQDPINPRPVALIGNIFCVAEFIEKRNQQKGLIVPESHVMIHDENGLIQLTIDEHSPIGVSVLGKLEVHPNFETLGINDGTLYTSIALASLIKMNRYLFESSAEAMKLVTVFQNLKATITKEVEKATNDRGNVKNLQSQVVSNLTIPEKFVVVTPIYKGFAPVHIEVEIILDPNDLSIVLISPMARDLQEKEKIAALETQEKLIRELVPWMPVMHV